MTESDSFTVLHNYRKATASEETAIWNYKGLEIHAVPQIHDHVGEIVRSSLPKGSLVLDLAAGSGAMCQRLKDLGMVPTGTDLVPENFRLHSEVDFFTANLNDELPAHLLGMFDCVTSTELIEHIENPRHLIRQCWRLVRPGGMVVISTPNTQSSIALAQYIRTGDFRWFTPVEYRRDGHINPILLPVLKNALEETGFVETRIDSILRLRFPGFTWWKMRLLAWVLRLVSARPLYEGDFIVVSTRRPR